MRSTDKPWITDNIKRKIRRRKRIYKKNDKTEKWHEVRRDIQAEIKEKRLAYYRNESEKIKSMKGSYIPFKVLHHITDPEKPKNWSIKSLNPNMSDKELAEDVASYFIKITDEFEPLDLTMIPEKVIPVTFSSPFEMAEPHIVADRIRAGKKPYLMSKVISCRV